MCRLIVKAAEICDLSDVNSLGKDRRTTLAGEVTMGEVKSSSDKQFTLTNFYGKEQVFNLADDAHVDGVGSFGFHITRGIVSHAAEGVGVVDLGDVRRLRNR